MHCNQGLWQVSLKEKSVVKLSLDIVFSSMALFTQLCCSCCSTMAICTLAELRIDCLSAPLTAYRGQHVL